MCNTENNTLKEISSNAHRFFKSSSLSPQIGFAQYVLKHLLHLYFLNTKDLVAVDSYFKILYLKHIATSLFMAKHYQSLSALENQKSVIEKQYDHLCFNAKSEPFTVAQVKEDNEFLDATLIMVNQQTALGIEEIAKTLKISQKNIEKKIEKLFERFQEIFAIAIYVFQKSLRDCPPNEMSRYKFNHQVEHLIRKHLHLEQKYAWLFMAGMACFIAAIAILLSPNMMMVIGVNAISMEIFFSITGGIFMLANQFYPEDKDIYTTFLQF